MRYLLLTLPLLATACEPPRQKPGNTNQSPGSERGRGSMVGTDTGNTTAPDISNASAPREPTP